MVATNSKSIIKYFLGSMNFLLVVLGILTLSVGIWVLLNNKAMVSLSSEAPKDVQQQYNRSDIIEQTAYVLIAIGVFICIINLFGCCGSYNESRALLILHAVCVSLFLIFQIACGILAYTRHTQIIGYIENRTSTAVKYNYGNGDANQYFSWQVDNLQQSLHCCFVHPNNNNAFIGDQKNLVPPSCCKVYKKDGMEKDAKYCKIVSTLRSTEDHNSQRGAEEDKSQSESTEDKEMEEENSEEEDLNNGSGDRDSEDDTEDDSNVWTLDPNSIRYGRSLENVLHDNSPNGRMEENNARKCYEDPVIEKCVKYPNSDNSYINDSCSDAFISWIKSQKYTIILIICSIAVIELLTIILASHLAKITHKKTEKMQE